jgi:uncharacterized membrane protein YfcA
VTDTIEEAQTTAPPGAARRAWAVSGALTGLWVVVVATGGLIGRVLDHWESAFTMLFGSFLAGSSPEGGGAVAFPVFTKVLEVPAPVARTFGLSIQAVGMTVAVVAILLNHRRIHLRAALVGSAAAIIGFLASVALFSYRDELFWPPMTGAGWVKATFSVVLATTSVLMIRHLRVDRRGGEAGPAVSWSRRTDAAIVVAGLVGGVLSSWTGTGANIIVFLVLMVILGVRAKVALPTAIIVMAAVSCVGFVLFGLIDGQLAVEVSGDTVVSVGGTPTDLPAAQNDLLGLWLAAVPVVVWGAPLGSLVAAKVRESWLVGFVAVLASVEVITTFVLVDDLRSNPAITVYLAAGLVVVPAVFIALSRRRSTLFG